MLLTRDVNSRVAQMVELLTSELVTNAILHAGSACVLVVRVENERVRVEVEDSSRVVPIKRDPPLLSSSGRGMAIVDHVAHDWGVDHVAGGKRVWFEIPFDTPPLPDWVLQQARLLARRDSRYL